MICGDVIADIGSDHAYLPIWLCLNKKIKKAYAFDISEKCVKRIQSNLKKYNISEDIIIPALSDGLSYFDNSDNNENISELTDIIIAGMGGENIAEIIKNIKNIKNLNLILQPNSKIEFLKNFLYENYFDIIKETATESKKRFYRIINAKFTGENND